MTVFQHGKEVPHERQKLSFAVRYDSVACALISYSLFGLCPDCTGCAGRVDQFARPGDCDTVAQQSWWPGSHAGKPDCCTQQVQIQFRGRTHPATDDGNVSVSILRHVREVSVVCTLVYRLCLVRGRCQWCLPVPFVVEMDGIPLVTL